MFLAVGGHINLKKKKLQVFAANLESHFCNYDNDALMIWKGQELQRGEKKAKRCWGSRFRWSPHSGRRHGNTRPQWQAGGADTALWLLQSQSYQTCCFAFCFCACEKQFVHSFRQACWMEVISDNWLQAEMSALGLQGNGNHLESES